MDEQNKAGEVHDPAEDYEVNFEASETAESNDEDVKTALERETQDGKGGAVVPSADFDSFATEDVENDVTDDENETRKEG